MEADGDHYAWIVKKLSGGRIIPFLGAGANLCDREDEPWTPGRPFLPSGSELAAHLADEGMYPKPGDSDLLRVSQYVDRTGGEDELYRVLHEVFGPECPPTSLHRLLARVARYLAGEGLPQLLAVTTNYDDLLEKALTDAGLEYDVLCVAVESGVRETLGGPLSNTAGVSPSTSGYAFSPDGRALAISGIDNNMSNGEFTAMVWLWNLAPWKPLGTIVPAGGNSSVTSVAVTFGPDGKLLATGDSDGVNGKVRLWDPAHPKRPGIHLNGGGSISSLAFSPDGQTLAGISDGAVQLSDVASRKLLGTSFVAAGERPVSRVAFSPDGKTLVGIRKDGKVLLWKGLLWTDDQDLQDQVCRLVRRNLTPAEWASVAPPDLAYRPICPG